MYVIAERKSGSVKTAVVIERKIVGYSTAIEMMLQYVCVTTSSTFERHQKMKLKSARKQ